MKRNLWTKIEENLLINSYPSSNEKELKKLFPNRSYDSIKLKAAKLGIKKQLGFKSEANLSVLLEDSYESYYWIGFLMADGYISHNTNRLKLSLSQKDSEHVYKFAKFIDCKNVREYELEIKEGGFGSGIKRVCEITAQDNLLIPKIIKKYDFKPRKTYNPPNLDFLKIDFDLFCSFLIGFIDGDGSVQSVRKNNEYRIFIRCHKSWMNNLQWLSDSLTNHLNLKNNVGALYREGKLSSITINNSKAIKFLKNKKKELGLPALKRKWDKIDENRVFKQEKYEANVENIKNLLNGKYTTREISSKTGLSTSRVNVIINEVILIDGSLKVKRDVDFRKKESYRKKMSQSKIGKNSGEKHGMSKVSKNDVLKIRNLYKETNMSQREIADIFEISRGAVGDIVNYKTWKDV